MKRKPNLNNLYTEKQVQALTTYATQSFKIMILSGAVRTGKTVIDNDIFLMELRRVRRLADKNGVKEPIYILAGYSSTTITNNILNPLENKYRIKFQFDRNNAFRLYGVKVIMAYTGNDRGASAIRGSTAYGAYINEASLATENVFHEINNRVSVDGGRIIADTNPESPTHWLKKKYIDRANDPATRTVVINFKLDDNRRFLSDEYISQLKASYGSGALYDRAILGLWTAAEGAVYPDFDDSNYIEREDLPKMKKYIAGVDWGYKHYGSIVVIGVDYDDNFYLVEEHAKQLKQVEYWVDVAHEMQERYGRKLLFVADSARTEHIDTFNMNGIDTILANKKVDAGIELMAMLIKRKQFRVVRDVLDATDNRGESISIFEDNIHGYVWDEKKGVVVKEHDDTLDPIRYVIMEEMQNKGTVNIAELASLI
ncbi:PBSX family phage terminase large subunit [Leuconostoc sp.]